MSTASSSGGARRASRGELVSTRATAHDAALVGEKSTGGGLPPQDPEQTPYLLDFYPLQDPVYTLISPFFDALKKGNLITSWCPDCKKLHWPPRVACDACTAEKLEWRDLSKQGTVFAFTEMILGAPLGFEKDVPFVIAVVEIDGAPFKILTRIDDAKYADMKIGSRVELKVHRLKDGRVFYRFRPSH